MIPVGAGLARDGGVSGNIFGDWPTAIAGKPGSHRGSVSYRAALEHLNLMACTRLPDFAERDLNNVTNTARILVQDVSDVFRVIEHRGFDTPSAA